MHLCMSGQILHSRTYLQIQQLFLSSVSLPLCVADKKMALAAILTVFPETAIVS